MDETTSLVKVESNKKNAQKSTGPRTKEGKEMAALNALKHGLLSRELVIREGDGKEDEGEFLALLNGLKENLAPEGSIEEMLVERIAACFWRLRRAVRFESGKLREELDSLYRKHRGEVTWLGEKVNILDDFDRLKQAEEDTISGNQNCIKMLRKGLDLSNPHEGKPINMLAYYEGLITAAYTGEDWLDEALDDRFIDGEMTLQEMRDFVSSKGWTDDRLRENFIQQDLRGIEESKQRLLELQALKRDAELTLSRLAHTKALLGYHDIEKVNRYEAAIERQLYRALNQLERMQRQRAGDHVPPPINVEVSSEPN